MSTSAAEVTGRLGANGTSASFGAEVARMLTRVALGWFLFYQGWTKVLQEVSGGSGSFYAGNMFQGGLPGWLPQFIALPYGYLLPWAEVLFGLLLVLGLFHRVTAAAVTFMFVTIGIAWLNAGNLLPRHQLMVFAPLALYFLFTGPGRFSVDAMREKGKVV